MRTQIGKFLVTSLIAQHKPPDAKIENICESCTYIMGSWGLPTCVFASMQAAMPLKIMAARMLANTHVGSPLVSMTYMY